MDTLITVVEGESPLSINFTCDAFICSIIFIVSGLFVRNYIKTETQRKLIGCGLGVISVILLSGFAALYVAFTVFVTIAWLHLPFRKRNGSTTTMFVLLIAVRVLYRYSEYLFVVKTSETGIAKAFHMYITLRCVSIIYEICKFHNLKNNSVRDHLSAPRTLKKEPDAYDVFCYLFYAPALVLGPFYTFQTYRNHITMPYKQLTTLPCYKIILEKVGRAVAMFFVYFVADYIITNLIGITILDFNDSSIVQCVAFVFITNVQYSFYLSFFWRLAESSCIAWGLGAYDTHAKPGQGPIEQNDSISKTCDGNNWKFDTIDNGNGENWFLQNSLDEMVKNWNQTVRWWLVRYCYTTNKIPKQHRLLRIFFTQFINALWHGGRLGSYCSLVVIVFAMIFENLVEFLIRHYIQTKAGRLAAYYCKRFVFPFIIFPYCMFSFIFPFDTIRGFMAFSLPQMAKFILSMFTSVAFVEFFSLSFLNRF